jgi:outer membrane protein assembly factor BamB
MMFAVLAAAASPALGDPWPAWRGPQADGRSNERGLPLAWGPGKNIRWKIPLPEPGNSTPIVWGKRVFITQGLDKGRRRAVIAFHRDTGLKLWQGEVICTVPETTHSQNPPCSASPVTDGTAVYAHFASAGVVAYDFDGKKLWHRDLGPVRHMFGNGSSPVLYKNALIVYQGPGEPTFVTALNKHTGETLWTRTEPGINNNLFGSWSTPVVIRARGRDELIMPLPGDRVGGDGVFKAYDPNTGAVLWRCRGLGTEVYAMPVVSAAGDMVVGISGHNGPTMAVRPGGMGDVTATHRLWRMAGKLPQRVGSGILDRGRLFVADAEGFVECLDAKNGTLIWKERLPGRLWGSMLLAEGRVYVSSLEGKTFVIAAELKFRLLTTNDIEETVYAGLAVSEGAIFLRTHGHLYCIADAR